MDNCYAMVLVSPKKFTKATFKVPKIEDDQLLLRIEMVSICGSDRHLFDGTHKASSFPKILGHEIVGFVDKIGKQASKDYGIKGLTVGDRVTVEPYIMCKNCEYCLTGNYQFHTPRKNYGVSLTCDQPPYLFGGYSQYMIILPGSKLHKINKDIPAESACLSSVIGNGIRWVKTKAQIGLEESVAIIGVGAQGLASVIAAKEAGAKPIIVLGISKDVKKFKLAEEFGADYIIDMEKNDAIKEIEKITNGRMVDVAIECAGVEITVQTSISLVRSGGRIVLAGLTGEKPVNLITDHIVNNELDIKGGHGQAWNVEDAVKIINSRKYPIEKMITHRFPLDKVQEAMELFISAPAECIRIGLLP